MVPVEQTSTEGETVSFSIAPEAGAHIRKLGEMGAAGKEVVYSDIPQSLLPAFAGLALRMKDAKVRSVVFKPSASFFSGDPDFDYLRDTVAKAIDPPGTRRKKDDPARPKNTANSCAYDPA